MAELAILGCITTYAITQTGRVVVTIFSSILHLRLFYRLTFVPSVVKIPRVKTRLKWFLENLEKSRVMPHDYIFESGLRPFEKEMMFLWGHLRQKPDDVPVPSEISHQRSK